MAVGVGGAGVATGVGGAVSSVVGVPGSSSGTSLPFRFLPCRRQGKRGVARTRTSHGNLKFVIEEIAFSLSNSTKTPTFQSASLEIRKKIIQNSLLEHLNGAIFVLVFLCLHTIEFVCCVHYIKW